MEENERNALFFCDWKVDENISSKRKSAAKVDEIHKFVRDDAVILKREINNLKR